MQETRRSSRVRSERSLFALLPFTSETFHLSAACTAYLDASHSGSSQSFPLLAFLRSITTSGVQFRKNRPPPSSLVSSRAPPASRSERVSGFHRSSASFLLRKGVDALTLFNRFDRLQSLHETLHGYGPIPLNRKWRRRANDLTDSYRLFRS